MIYLNGVDYKVLNHILDYIYEGEVQLYQKDLNNFLEVAEKLKINGLIEGQEVKDILEQEKNVEILEDIQSSYTKDIGLNQNFEMFKLTGLFLSWLNKELVFLKMLNKLLMSLS